MNLNCIDMKKIYTLILPLLAIVCIASGCREKESEEAMHAPELISIIPKAGYAGTEAIISGYWFSEDASCLSVEIGGVPAEITGSTIDRIYVIMPDLSLGSYKVKVKSGDMVTEGLGFRYAEYIEKETLSIYSYSPSSGTEGDEIAINGACFSPDPARNEVTVNGKRAEIKDASETRLTVILPDNEPGTYAFTVTVDGVTVQGPMFTYNRKPELTVTGVTPETGCEGTEISISGLCFSGTIAENTVTVNGVRAEVTFASPTLLKAIVPANPEGTYPVSVTVGDKTAEGAWFTYVEKVYTYTVRTISGSAGRADANAMVSGDQHTARWRNPRGLCLLPDGNMAAIESGNNYICKVDLSTYKASTTEAGHSLLNAPWGVARNGEWLYVASKGNGNIVRYNYITDTAEKLEPAFPGKSPMDIRFDAEGNAYLAVRDNYAIYKYPGGVFSSGNQQIFATMDGNKGPLALEFDSMGNLIATTNGCQVICISPDGSQTTIAGIRDAKDDDNGIPGQPLTAKFGADLYGIAIDKDDNIYITNGTHHVIKKITRGEKGYEDATVTTIAGQSKTSGYKDGTGAESVLTTPGQIIADNTGNKLYFSEYNGYRIREITIE